MIQIPKNRLPPNDRFSFPERRKIKLGNFRGMPAHPMYLSYAVFRDGENAIRYKDGKKVVIGKIMMMAKPGSRRDVEILEGHQRKSPAKYSIGQIKRPVENPTFLLSGEKAHLMDEKVVQLLLIKMKDPPKETPFMGKEPI
ncbi:MAG: hypothetical protein ABIG39_01950 [Candidatus Micrarchaeota archaeon]